MRPKRISAAASSSHHRTNADTNQGFSRGRPKTVSCSGTACTLDDDGELLVDSCPLSGSCVVLGACGLVPARGTTTFVPPPVCSMTTPITNNPVESTIRPMMSTSMVRGITPMKRLFCIDCSFSYPDGSSVVLDKSGLYYFLCAHSPRAR